MPDATVIFGPGVDAALTQMINHVEPDEIPAVLRFLDRIQTRLVRVLATFPEAGNPFQGRVRMMVIDGYVFLYEQLPDTDEIHVLDMIAPGRDWR